jgi:putative hydrolase of the HAD superfamily
VGLVVGIDGDDTLWHNEKVFSVVEERFRELLQPLVPAGTDLHAELTETERANLPILGYGVKAFTLSMIETAVRVAASPVPAAVLAELVAEGKRMHSLPVELLTAVEVTLPVIADRWRVVLITKGDLLHQEAKVARSGLLHAIHDVQVVSEKDPDTYRRVLDRAGVDPADFVMVGDSLRSDIVPVLAIGGRGIHVPGFRVWELDQADRHPEPAERWCQVPSFADVPGALERFDCIR